jgi:hypothetical protein
MPIKKRGQHFKVAVDSQKKPKGSVRKKSGTGPKRDERKIGGQKRRIPL